MERAVIYCRVSTEEITQMDALQGQIVEAKRAVSGKRWALVDSYIDEGKSGTTTKRRDEYNRLVSDLSSEKFDIIVVKSQDRLMRNTKEWYIFVDQLVQSGKQLYFYLENKFYTPDDALITGIKAILAEEFSRDLSKKINNA
ncbi:recombinase family protein, partial [Anaerotignum sp.]|uniref:recombinase family protein n=1 Tax=Anaerotignum sp. TaxID=2039241 RepID=UPI00271468C2